MSLYLSRTHRTQATAHIIHFKDWQMPLKVNLHSHYSVP